MIAAHGERPVLSLLALQSDRRWPARVVLPKFTPPVGPEIRCRREEPPARSSRPGNVECRAEGYLRMTLAELGVFVKPLKGADEVDISTVEPMGVAKVTDRHPAEDR